MRLLLMLLLFPALALGQSLHITGVSDHVRGATESTLVPLHSKVITATMDGKLYTLQQNAGAMSFAYKFEVGKDYEVRKLTDSRISVWVQRKNRRDHEDMAVVGVEEIKPPS